MGYRERNAGKTPFKSSMRLPDPTMARNTLCSIAAVSGLWLGIGSYWPAAVTLFFLAGLLYLNWHWVNLLCQYLLLFAAMALPLAALNPEIAVPRAGRGIPVWTQLLLVAVAELFIIFLVFLLKRMSRGRDLKDE